MKPNWMIKSKQITCEKSNCFVQSQKLDSDDD